MVQDFSFHSRAEVFIVLVGIHLHVNVGKVSQISRPNGMEVRGSIPRSQQDQLLKRTLLMTDYFDPFDPHTLRSMECTTKTLSHAFSSFVG